MYKNLVTRCACALAVASFSIPFSTHAQAPAPAPLKAAFVYVAPLTPAGWVRQHEQGRLAVHAALGNRVETRFVENVPEGADAERVIRDLAQQGHRIIFTPSFGYMEPTLKVAREFPDVKFESITGYKTAPNVATANARYYEGRYLAGVAAGRLATQAGYVAGFPIPEVIQAAQERGKLAVAYHSDMRQFAPDAQIVAVTHLWGDYYTRRVQAVLDGKWQSGSVWGGVKDGMVRVDGFGPKVPAVVRDEVLARQADMAAGRLQVFASAAGVRDNEGRTAIAAGQLLSDAEILGMKWLAEGVLAKIDR